MTASSLSDRKSRLIFASGDLGVALLTFAVSQWFQSYYLPTSGGQALIAPVAFLGTAMLLAKLVDGLADPMSGYFSDTARTPLGRRRPFLLIFGPLAGLAFACLFPRVAPGETIGPLQLVLTLCAYYLFFTLAVTPYQALLPELAKSDEERLTVTSTQTFFNFTGIALAMILGASIRTTWWMAPLLGTIGACALMLPGLFLREPPLPPPLARRPSWTGMFAELGLALQNRLFMLYVASQLCLWFGFNMILAWMPYLVERLLRGPSVTQANLAVLGTAVVVLPLAYRLVLRMGKVRGLMAAMAGFALGFVLLSQLVLLPAPPIDVLALMEKEHFAGTEADFRAQFAPEELSGEPATENLRLRVGLAILMCLGLPLGMFFLAPATILSQVIDLDARERGGGREGMFFAAQAVVIQTGGAGANWVLQRVMTQGGEAVTVSGIANVGPVAAAIVCVGIFVLWRFEQRLRVVDTKLKEAL